MLRFCDELIARVDRAGASAPGELYPFATNRTDPLATVEAEHRRHAVVGLRRRLLTMPGRLTKTDRCYTFHLPARWPWRDAATEALTRIRALPTGA